MARFSGKIGFGPTPTEARPGIWEDVIVEKLYYGDVLRTSRRLDSADSVNPDLKINNSISVVGDAFLEHNFETLLYIIWNGRYWTVDEITVQRPRLILQLGGIYNGDTAAAPDPA